MDDLPGLLARDFGFRQQGKSAPMKPSGDGSGSARSAAHPNPPSAYDDVFGGPPPRYPNRPSAQPAPASSPQPQFDSIFDGFNGPTPAAASGSAPVFDKPVYDDDDIFDGIPGTRSSAYDDVFASMSAPPKKGHAADGAQPYGDLLASMGKGSATGPRREEEGSDAFDDLVPRFGASSRQKKSESQESNRQKTVPEPASMPEDPFVVLETSSTPVHPSGLFSDPLEQLGKTTNSGSPVETSSAGVGVFDIDAFDGLVKSMISDPNDNRKDSSPLKTVPNSSHQNSSLESVENVIPKTGTSRSFDSRSSVPNSVDSPYDRKASKDQSPRSFEHLETADDVWLTVSEIPLFTQPTSAPPPSRPPPKLVIKQASVGRMGPRRKDDEYFSQSGPSYHYSKGSVRKPSVSPIDELEDFAMGKPQTCVNEHAEVLSSEEDIETNSAAAAAASSSSAAMKEAMDRAEARFKHAKEVRERERDTKSSRSREFAQEREEKAMPDILDSEDKENQEKVERERLQRETEETDRERRRLEKEREQELAREREKARQAVERATREARERAAADARLKAERAAVEKANAEARQRAGRHAVQRAAAEARERAAAEAQARAERAAAEARERASAEAREKAARERAAVDRAAAEARVRAERVAVDRAHAEARQRAAAAAREKQNAENDLDSFFGMGARPSSSPIQRDTTSENVFDNQAQTRSSADGTRRASSTSSSTIRKTTSTTNIVDDLSSIFGATPSSGDFQEVEGESEERRRARLERHQRTLERAAKALDEKNERDMQTQREQAERHRFAETLDTEIKRWAAGKEGNLRALLSTLHYVLWPECGWQPVSLTDLITVAAVKKAYRKATLCIHPDKVQQKGATLQQKYIAEKVFDLLKEAWNKLNSEELF
ncbi:auxilin-related protein 2-like [Iris pallida]|uniref:Auxilin-related protein 2-like n=1 Tax=Iris pallida TaxID=29817 RepID=A0AAX6HNV4_IRIPA|nr:auxilin-related protein 2-like [Iris pallida]